MKVMEKHANRRVNGVNVVTFPHHSTCPHRNGWYVTVKFWIFKKHIFVCSDCGAQSTVRNN